MLHKLCGLYTPIQLLIDFENTLFARVCMCAWCIFNWMLFLLNSPYYLFYCQRHIADCILYSAWFKKFNCNLKIGVKNRKYNFNFEIHTDWFKNRCIYFSNHISLRKNCYSLFGTIQSEIRPVTSMDDYFDEPISIKSKEMKLFFIWFISYFFWTLRIFLYWNHLSKMMLSHPPALNQNWFQKRFLRILTGLPHRWHASAWAVAGSFVCLRCVCNSSFSLATSATFSYMSVRVCHT